MERKTSQQQVKQTLTRAHGGLSWVMVTEALITHHEIMLNMYYWTKCKLAYDLQVQALKFDPNLYLFGLCAYLCHTNCFFGRILQVIWVKG